MRYSFFIILLLILSLIFAFQNTEAISVKFLIWSFNSSQALTIILIFFAGVITGVLFLAQRLYAKNREVRNMRKEFLETGRIEAKKG